MVKVFVISVVAHSVDIKPLTKRLHDVIKPTVFEAQQDFVTQPLEVNYVPPEEPQAKIHATKKRLKDVFQKQGDSKTPKAVFTEGKPSKKHVFLIKPSPEDPKVCEALSGRPEVKSAVAKLKQLYFHDRIDSLRVIDNG